MKKEVHISPNFWESLDDVSSAMNEILQNNVVNKFKVSPLVGCVLRNMNGFVEEEANDKIGKFRGIDVYRNVMARDDYIEYI